MGYMYLYQEVRAVMLLLLCAVSWYVCVHWYFRMVLWSVWSQLFTSILLFCIVWWVLPLFWFICFFPFCLMLNVLLGMEEWDGWIASEFMRSSTFVVHGIWWVLNMYDWKQLRVIYSNGNFFGTYCYELWFFFLQKIKN